MHLALQITSSQAGPMGPSASKVFSEAGGTIGRVDSNDWVLPDAERWVSGRHAIVRCMGGMFSLEDVSTNGTFINGETDSVGSKSEPAMLKNGDKIVIGDYEIYVSIVEGDDDMVPSQQTSPPIMDYVEPGGTGVYTTPPSMMTSPPTTPTISPGAPGIGPVDPLDMLGSGPPPAPTAPASFPDHSSAMSDSFTPPASPVGGGQPSAGSAIPDDWDMTEFGASGNSPGFAPPVPPQQPMAPPQQPMAPPPPQYQQPAMPPQGGGTMNAPGPSMAQGAGDASIAALMPLIVQGMMDVLKSRAEVKSEFRMAVTTIKPIENNPLKFSPNADAAIDHLFNNQQAGYLNPAQAFEEGFDDIKAHQLAMMAGMRAAFEHMLHQFSPDVLEGHFEGGGKRGKLMGMASKVRYWDMYRDLFEKITRDSDDNFRRMFGEEFATAYEQQMQKIPRR